MGEVGTGRKVGGLVGVGGYVEARGDNEGDAGGIGGGKEEGEERDDGKEVVHFEDLEMYRNRKLGR